MAHFWNTASKDAMSMPVTASSAFWPERSFASAVNFF